MDNIKLTSDGNKGTPDQYNQLHVYDGVHTLKDDEAVPTSDMIAPENGQPQPNVTQAENR